MQTTRVQRWERKRKRDCVLCARLMRNGFAHITSSSVTFQKNETKKSLTHRVFCFLSRFALKKTLEFLRFFPRFCFIIFYFVWKLFRFPISSFFIEDTFIYRSSSSSSERERERKKDRRERETKYENSRASRETTTFATLWRKTCGISLKQKSSAISFLVTTSSSSPLTLHLLRSRYI